jgi:hypothetical protein
MEQWVKLRTGEGQHYDRQIGLHIRGKEKKPLPENIPAGSLTAQRLAIGGLVICGPDEEEIEVIEVEPEPDLGTRIGAPLQMTPDTPTVGADPSVCPDEPDTPAAAEAIEESVDPVPDAAAEPEPLPEPESRESFIDRTAKQILSKMNMAELREACKRHGIDVPKRPKAETLAKLIAQAEWELQQG